MKGVANDESGASIWSRVTTVEDIDHYAKSFGPAYESDIFYKAIRNSYGAIYPLPRPSGRGS